MTMPYQYVPGTTYHAFRRCRDGQMLINPSSTVNRVVKAMLYRYIERYGLELHLFLFMPNHYHLVVTDPGQGLPHFLSTFHSQVTKKLNACTRREGYLWEPGYCPKVRVIENEKVLETMAYILTNPVRAGLVPSPREWPGVNNLIEEMDGRELFTPSVSSHEADPGSPEMESLRLTMPPCLRPLLSQDEYLEEIRARVDRMSVQARQEMAIQGRSFLGARGVLKRKRTVRPRNEPRKCRNIPTFSCNDPELRRAAIAELKRFRKEYRLAFEEFRKGNREVLFPMGTFKICRDAGARAHSPPGQEATA